jgi:hypothetical protein
MSYWIVDGRKLTNEEYEELQRQEELDQQRAREEASRLAKQLGQAYAALQEHLRRNPGVDEEITDERELDQQIYDQLRQNLERADQAPRCQKIKADGTGCGSPKMKNHIYCYAHYQMLEARAEKLVLPALEDANAIQMAVMLVQRALIDDEITEKRAGLLLYSLQIAATNVDKTTFGQAAHEELVTEMEDEEELLGRHEQAMEKQKKVEEIRKGKALPRINTDDTDHDEGEKQNLPRMDADERGSGEKALPMMGTDDTDQAGVGGRILPQSASGGSGGTRSHETYADLCPSTRKARVNGARWNGNR